jgi:hypothetical protein
MGNVIPKTKRFCVYCEKETLFEYSRNIGHSQCTKCGGHYGADPDSYFTTVFKEKCKLERELDKIKTNYIKLLELFISNKLNFPKNIRNKIEGLYK